MDRASGKTLRWHLGDRTAESFRELFGQFDHLDQCIFYTDDYSGYRKVILVQQHVLESNIHYLFKEVIQIFDTIGQDSLDVLK